METKNVLTALAALAQESRLAVFRLLVQTGPDGLAASRIAEKLDLPASSLSFHLKELSHAGLVTSRQESRFIYYMADFAQMAVLMTFLTRNCCKGMPQECLAVMETALEGCCAPSQIKRKPERSQS